MERVWLVSYGLAWLLVVLQGLTLVSLLWAIGQIHLKRAPEAHALITDEGPELHTQMPALEGRDTEGRRTCIADYQGRNLVVLLVSPGCKPCEELLRDLPVTRHSLQAPPEFLVVMEASPREAQSAHQRYRLPCRMIPDEAAGIRNSLGVERTPYAFLVDSQGVVRMKGVVNHRRQLEGLIGRRGRYIGGLVWETSETADPSALGETVGADGR